MNIQQIVSKLQSAIDLDEDLITGRVYGARLNSERAAAILAAEMPRWVSFENPPDAVGNYLAAATIFSHETIGQHVSEWFWDGEYWRELRDKLDAATFGMKITHYCALPSPPRDEAK